VKHGSRMTARATVFLAVLLWMAALPLAAQQASGLASQPGAGVAPASSARAPLSGPRLRPEWRRVEPRFADLNTPAPSDNHTITISTVVLVLVVIIAVLLLVR
jgi:hypothetical protein